MVFQRNPHPAVHVSRSLGVDHFDLSAGIISLSLALPVSTQSTAKNTLGERASTEISYAGCWLLFLEMLRSVEIVIDGMNVSKSRRNQMPFLPIDDAAAVREAVFHFQGLGANSVKVTTN